MSSQTGQRKIRLSEEALWLLIDGQSIGMPRRRLYVVLGVEKKANIRGTHRLICLNSHDPVEAPLSNKRWSGGHPQNLSLSGLTVWAHPN